MAVINYNKYDKTSVHSELSKGIPMQSSSDALIILIVLLSILWLLCRCYAGRKSSVGSDQTKRRRLPPGSMGWPYIGETLQMYSNSNPNNFFAEKQRRYGAVFKTHILGCPCVMVSSPEAAKFVLVTKAHLFKPTFPNSKERMLGPQAIFFQRGDYHARLRRLVLRAFMPDSIKTKLASIEDLAMRALSSIEKRGTAAFINTFQEMKTYTLNVALISVFGMDGQCYLDELKLCYYNLEKGYNSMPLNFPGTLFYKSMKARRQLGFLVARIISDRRNQYKHRDRESHPVDILGSFMDEKESLTDDQIADNIIGVIFAARDTTASVLTWILKYLAENPAILLCVTEEHDKIRSDKEINGGGSEGMGLTWEDTKKMPITCRVIQETMRLASILSFTFREAVEDVYYQGYLIPKGWKVLPLFRIIHHDPDHFPDPSKFHPDRFEISPKPNTFMPFGNGIHACPGNELARLEILLLLHHLTTKYRWSLCGPETGVQFGPFALPMNGLPINVTLKKLLIYFSS